MGEAMTENIRRYISELVQINSEQTAAKDGAPFGTGARKALDWFLNLAHSFGFETINYDGYAGEVIFGDGEEFAILAHLDVVPAGDGWTHDPFGGEIDKTNRRIWGRGTMDDKGPAIISLCAMKALKDEGFTPKRKIKLIVGCNEESGWGCIDYYIKHAHMPEEGFTPDADFPVIYAEKGILHLKLKYSVKGNFHGLKGGTRVNMVCDYCSVSAPLNEEKLRKLNLAYENGAIVSRGKSAHGSTPDEGINAIPPVLSYLGLENMREQLFETQFGLAELQDITGRLTFSPNVIEQVGENIFVTCDIRYPATYKLKDILGAITVPYEIISAQDPIYNDKECKLITTLCGVYNEVTGKNLQPLAIGGGTYARAIKCGAGFGPEESGEEVTIHQADEYITFEKIETCFKAYKLAIERLTK